MPYKFNPLTGKLDYYETGGSGGPSGNTRVEYRQITAQEALDKELTLAQTPTNENDVRLDIISGTTQEQGTDYNVTGNILTWDGLALDLTLHENDKLRIIYTV
jgi:hypothetical protein